MIQNATDDIHVHKLIMFRQRKENFMESFVEALKGIQGVVWGPITILLLLFTGLYYTIRLKGIQIFHLHKSFQYIFEKEEGQGDVSTLGTL